ncbi:PPC domain-containing DNA-binding protein [Pseudoroseicyclus sp. CXY001]|uniref:PPC domain-containing DNA-binding protein n=1 Tax=Pseudoroseicyclus sp. CXY001 TaxID=3242492 RepID=UPI0035714E9A
MEWTGAETRLIALRLSPGEDLRAGIEAAFAASGATAGFLAACVGSLAEVAIRPAGEDAPLTLAEPLEIVSLSGTLSPDGVHLHIAVAGADGRMTGGHLLPGALVRTTAELVLAVTEAALFRRATDPATGWKELDLG